MLSTRRPTSPVMISSLTMRNIHLRPFRVNIFNDRSDSAFMVQGIAFQQREKKRINQNLWCAYVSTKKIYRTKNRQNSVKEKKRNKWLYRVDCKQTSTARVSYYCPNPADSSSFAGNVADESCWFGSVQGTKLFSTYTNYFGFRATSAWRTHFISVLSEHP